MTLDLDEANNISLEINGVSYHTLHQATKDLLVI